MTTVQLLNVNEALKEMDKMINTSYRSWIGNEIKEFNNQLEWFQAYGASELNINTNKAYLDIFKTGKSLIVTLKDIHTNKPVKKLYYNKDITTDFTLSKDGLYYNVAWSKSGKKIEIDGLGWTLEQVRNWMIEDQVIPTIKEEIETNKDTIRVFFN